MKLYLIINLYILPHILLSAKLFDLDEIPQLLYNLFRCRTVLFKNSLLYSIKQWNILNSDIREIKSYSLFRKTLLTSTKPIANSIYKVHDSYGIKLLTRLLLGFSHLNEHKFRHNFRDTLNPFMRMFMHE